MKKASILSLLCLSFGLLMINNSYSQTETNVEALLQFASEQKALAEKNKKEAEEFALMHGLPIRQVNGTHTIEIMAISPLGMPIYYITDNLEAATTTRADKLWSGGGLGLSYSGSGYSKLGEWDGGAVLSTHTEFGSRVTQKDGATGSHYHATHVAGTMISAGSNDASSKGAAYAANLDAYEWTSDASEMATAAANDGMELSNHSYGTITGWYYDGSKWFWYGNTTISTTEDYNFGYYNSYAASWDDIAVNAPYYLIIKSAGNDRGSGPAPGTNHKAWNGSTFVQSNDTRDYDGGTTGYDCIGNKGVAKNLLTVGAVYELLDYNHPDDVIMSSFSGWGPADDGRIKPDIVAKGVNVYSTYNGSNTDYETLQGTSMSSPNTTGTLVLIREHYQALNTDSMRSATLKALVCHTADEAGDYDGPDYKFGWGLLNAEEAANLITIDANYQNIIDEQTLANAGTYTRSITASGNEPLKVTICWTDPKGTPVSASVDPSDAMLVNDLDLRITYSSTTYYPWKLDKDNPANAATNSGENDVDNIEQVYIANPAAGSYTITVDHDGTLASSQAFSIIISGIDDNSTTPTACVSDMVFPANSATGVSPSITLEWEKVLDAASYDLYFGTDGSGSSTPTNIVNGSSQSSNIYTPTALSSATTYYIQVVPRNTNGIKSGCTTIWSFTTATFTTNSTFSYTQNFDAFSSIGSGWEDETDDDFNWSVYTGSTPSGDTGPTEDHTSGSGKYLYTEASSPNDLDKRANLLSPVYNWSALTKPVLEFWYHMYGDNLGISPSWFFVDIYSGGEWHYNIWSKYGQQSSSGTDWQVATIDLSNYKSGSIHRIRFRVLTRDWSTDFAIDDIYIADGIATTWNGGTTDWETASNWSRSYIPTEDVNITIPTTPASGSNYPVIDSEAACYKLTIESAANVTISSSYSLSVGNDFLIESSTSSGTGSIIDNGTLSVADSTIVERAVSGDSGGINHYVSSPTDSPSYAVLFDASKGAYLNYYYEDPSWQRITSGQLTNGRGYVAAYNANKTIEFTGDINTGDITPSISSTTSDWNLIGNPYPSAVSLSSFFAENTTSYARINGTIYFWNQTSNYDADDYASYNSSSGGTAAVNGGSTPSAYLAVGQAFFAQSTGSKTFVKFSNSMRSAQDPTFFTPDPEKVQKIHLTLQDNRNNYNEIIISLIEEATDGFDYQFDGEKLVGNQNMAFYSLINDHTKSYVIQGLAPVEEEKEVNIGFHASNFSSLSMKVKKIQNLDGIDVFLIDKEENKTINLKDKQTYDFSALTNIVNDRFVIRFVNNTTNISGKTSQVEVYTYQNLVNLVLDQQYTVEIIDVLGKVHYQNQLSAGNHQLSLNGTSGIVFVNLYSTKESICKKILIK